MKKPYYFWRKSDFQNGKKCDRKWFSVIQNGPKGTSKMAAGGHFKKNQKKSCDWSKMARNAIEKKFPLFPTFRHFFPLSPLFTTFSNFSPLFTTFSYFSPLFHNFPQLFTNVRHFSPLFTTFSYFSILVVTFPQLFPTFCHFSPLFATFSYFFPTFSNF